MIHGLRAQVLRVCHGTQRLARRDVGRGRSRNSIERGDGFEPQRRVDPGDGVPGIDEHSHSSDVVAWVFLVRWSMFVRARHDFVRRADEVRRAWCAYFLLADPWRTVKRLGSIGVELASAVTITSTVLYGVVVLNSPRRFESIIS